MTTAQLFRHLRRSWRLVVLCTLAGALLGLGLARYLDKPSDGPSNTFWLGTETLVVNVTLPEDQRVDAVQAAVYATGGEVLNQVAPSLDLDVRRLTERVRVITDSQAQTIRIETVMDAATAEGLGTSGPELATSMANAIATELRTYVDRAKADTFAVQLAAAEDTVQDRADALKLAEEKLRLQQVLVDEILQTPVEEGEDPPVVPTRLLDTLNSARDDRDLAARRLDDAEVAREALAGRGKPVNILQTVQASDAIRIPSTDYASRIRSARQDAQRFDVTEVPPVDELSATILPDEPVTTPPVRAAIGAVLGLLIGVGIVAIRARLRRFVRYREDAEDAFAVPVIGEIPRMRRKERRRKVLHAISQEGSPVTEAYRNVRASLLFARTTSEADEPTGRDTRVVMVTSASPGEGKTTTASNLAVLLAEAGHSTVLINCDYRRPTLQEYFSTYLIPGRATNSEVPGLKLVGRLLSPEHHSAEEIIAHQRQAIEEARRRVDVVILDTAPLLATNDTRDLLPVTDLVLLVCREGRTRMAAAREVTEILDHFGAPRAGVVITDSREAGRRGRYDRYLYQYQRPGRGPTPASPTPYRSVFDETPDVDSNDDIDVRVPSPVVDLRDRVAPPPPPAPVPHDVPDVADEYVMQVNPRGDVTVTPRLRGRSQKMRGH